MGQDAEPLGSRTDQSLEAGSPRKGHDLGGGGSQRLGKVCPQYFESWGNESIKRESGEHITVPDTLSKLTSYKSSPGSVTSR